MRKSVCLNPEEIFHVHTWRCGHAGEEREEEYIKAAIRLGAKQITFTDHAPFPGNLFRGRMKMEELPEYEDTLWELRAKYQGKIQVRIGLEAEYLPGFQSYYEKLIQTSGKAGDCIQCGQCESVCPQHLSIISLLEEASEKLDK